MENKTMTIETVNRLLIIDCKDGIETCVGEVKNWDEIPTIDGEPDFSQWSQGQNVVNYDFWLPAKFNVIGVNVADMPGY